MKAVAVILALALCLGVAQARQLKTKDSGCKFKADRDYERDEFCQEFGLTWEVIVELNGWCSEVEVTIIKKGSIFELPCDCESKSHGRDWRWKKPSKRHYEGEVCEYTPETSINVFVFIYKFGYDWDTCLELNPWIIDVTVITESCFIPCSEHKSEKRIHVWPEMEDHPCDEPSWRPYKWFEQEDVYERRYQEYSRHEDAYSQDTGYGKKDDGYRQDTGYGKKDDGYGQDSGYGKKDDGYGQDTGYGKKDDGYGQDNGYGKKDGGYGGNNDQGNQDGNQDGQGSGNNDPWGNDKPADPPATN